MDDDNKFFPKNSIDYRSKVQASYYPLNSTGSSPVFNASFDSLTAVPRNPLGEDAANELLSLSPLLKELNEGVNALMGKNSYGRVAKLRQKVDRALQGKGVFAGSYLSDVNVRSWRASMFVPSGINYPAKLIATIPCQTEELALEELLLIVSRPEGIAVPSGTLVRELSAVTDMRMR